MKHYAYHNMSRRSQLTTKFLFQVTAQLSENFIFIYLGLSLFTERNLIFKPLFILITIVGICVARWCAVFPISRVINWVIRYRASRRGNVEAAEELPYAHQAMLFWAGLRGAVGVALAAGLQGSEGPVLRATVLVVVVLTVIIFGGTTARMLEILNIRTGVVEEIDSDDEFDIEFIDNNQGATFTRKSGTGIGHIPRGSNGMSLGNLNGDRDSSHDRGTYSSGNVNGHAGNGRARTPTRRSSVRNPRDSDAAEQGLLDPVDSGTPSQADDTDDGADLDLPPAARRIVSALREPTTPPGQYPTSGSRPDLRAAAGETHAGRIANTTSAISQLFSDISEDPSSAFRQIDEGFIKPHLLLDPGNGQGGGGGSNA
jgi:sodium/hydrogen exchanger-like protein 6/7